MAGNAGPGSIGWLPVPVEAIAARQDRPPSRTDKMPTLWRVNKGNGLNEGVTKQKTLGKSMLPRVSLVCTMLRQGFEP